jgi:hypothetical protein
VPHPLLFTVLTMALAMVPLGAWAALAAAMMRWLIHGVKYVALARDPQPNIAHFAFWPLVFPSGSRQVSAT